MLFYKLVVLYFFMRQKNNTLRNKSANWSASQQIGRPVRRLADQTFFPSRRTGIYVPHGED
jgi:hypothetical protein